MTNYFSHEDARRFYNRFGAKQDKQGFYEDAALDVLIEHGGFSNAQSVLEVGCGTGKLAARLLSDHLPASARYAGIDISETMVGLAGERLRPWAERTAVHINSGDFDFSSYGGPFDRIVVTYVFDLLSFAQITQALAAAHAVIQKGGLLCTAGLTKGTGFPSSATSTLWSLIHKMRPSLVGGCRPIVLVDQIPSIEWQIVHREVVVSATVPSEVLIAQAI